MGANNACHLSTRLLLIFIQVVLILATSCCTSAYGDKGGVTDPGPGTPNPSCCHIPGCC
ncbi:hypothetical protein BS78_09G051000 [Paspalum vaginatum]|nr:hypothetical protein BS78_09G051000 [Paspalum vaginatum]